MEQNIADPPTSLRYVSAICYVRTGGVRVSAVQHMRLPNEVIRISYDRIRERWHYCQF